MTKVKNKAVKYNKNAEALLTFGLPFSYNHRRRPVRRKNNHLPPGGFPEAERRKEAIDEADMELISSDSFPEYKNAVCQRTCQKTPDTAVLTAGVLLVTAITFAAGSFPETGNGAMVAFAETPGETGGQEGGNA